MWKNPENMGIDMIWKNKSGKSLLSQFFRNFA